MSVSAAPSSLTKPAFHQAVHVRVVVDGLTQAGRELLRGVMAYARAYTRWVLHVETDVDRPKGPDWQLDNAMIYAAPSQSLLDKLLTRGIPVVNCLAHFEPMGLPTVRTDDHAIGKMAAEYFLANGFGQFVFDAGPDRSMAATYRWEGFSRTLAGRGAKAVWNQALASPGDPLGQSGPLCTLIESLPKPVAVFFSHDTIARVAGDLLAGAGLHVPEHVAILGVDNDLLQCEICRPPLSSIAIAYETLGRQAAEMLDTILSGGEPPAQPVLIAPSSVVARDSTDIVALGAPQLAEALRFIRVHACDPCSVEDVLNQVLVSRRWLENQFKKHFGRTPHQEITRVRMESAKTLLRDPTLPLKVVSDRVGYGHVQNFVDIFRRTTGLTPARFRESARTPRNAE